MKEALKDKGRMAQWAIIALFLLLIIAWVAPQQIPVMLYKMALVSQFAHLGYWVDRTLFPHGRPGDMLEAKDWHSTELRRAILVSAVIVAGAFAL